ncbi:hypothetical protein BJX70DRAFT_117302 [Aspergillus crustosus]
MSFERRGKTGWDTVVLSTCVAGRLAWISPFVLVTTYIRTLPFPTRICHRLANGVPSARDPLLL